MNLASASVSTSNHQHQGMAPLTTGEHTLIGAFYGRYADVPFAKQFEHVDIVAAIHPGITTQLPDVRVSRCLIRKDEGVIVVDVRHRLWMWHVGRCVAPCQTCLSHRSAALLKAFHCLICCSSLATAPMTR